MQTTQNEIEQLRAEIEYYKKLVQWYRDTYETRSIAGVVKDKMSKQLKDTLGSLKMPSLPFQVKLNTNGKAQVQSIAASRASFDKSSFYSIHATDEKTYKIGVFIHLYYQDIWPEIQRYLKNMGINFDLLVTINEEDSQCEQTIASIRKIYPYAIIRKVPNRGLDVGPFFELMNYVISRNIKYDYVLKIHTKKSLGVNAFVGENWRKKSYESLMGSYSIVAHILRLFKADPAIGMIGPYETRMSTSVNDVNTGGNANGAHMKHLTKRFNVKDPSLDFFGGTMFWVKWSIYEEKFKNNTLTINDFEPGYKSDGLLAHGMERLFASIVRDAGYKLYEMNKVNDYNFYKHRRKKICWVHPGFGIGGGNRVILDICREQLKYYDVYSISFMGHAFTNWMDVEHNIMNFSNQEEAHYFIKTMEIDYVFATGWQTVDFVKNIQSPCKKYYFIQDYEPWFSDADGEKTKATYKNSFNANIVIADWLKQKLYAEHQLKTIFIKISSVNYEAPPILPAEDQKPTKLLFYFKLKNHCGRGADLIEALLKKLVKHPDLELNVIGHEDPKIDGINFLGELHGEKLLDLYKSNDIFVDLSRHRGISTIAMEVAQFGVVPLLAAKEYGLAEYGFADDENCLFVKDVDDTYKKLIDLTQDAQQYKRLKRGILELSKSFRYQYTVNDMNQTIDIVF